MNATSEIRPPVARVSDAFKRLLRPALGFNRPLDVLKDPLLDDDIKRAILSSWASDACAVEEHPDLRWFIGSETPVPLNEVLEALARLDRRGAARKEEEVSAPVVYRSAPSRRLGEARSDYVA